MIVNVIVEKTEKNWGAYSPDDIGGIYVVGDSRAEVIDLFRSALKFHIDGMRAEGLEAPTIDGLNVQELIAA